MKKKQAITIIAGEETYKNLTIFKTIKELNETVRAYKEKFVKQLNKNQLAVLVHLHNYSAKFFGVSFKTKKKIAEALNISRRTVIRACQHLESIGIIKQLEMKRKSDMRQTSNIIVIQPIIVEEQIVTPEPAKNDDFCHTKKTTTKTLKQNIKDINIRKEYGIRSHENDKDFIDYRIPQSMRMKLATAFESNVINESFQNALNIAKKAAKKFSLLADKDVFNNILANASVALFSKTHEAEHNGTLMKNPIGYFTNTFKTMAYNYIDSFRDIHIMAQRKTYANASGVYYNWLENSGSTEPSTNTIDNSLTPGIYYKISKEEADEMGLY
ncbi:helix-turn-helix domain-containing protein [Bacillus thuringiensis]|uniref:Helix-turn-helix domain-containing protein n=1 Tax=Bacillus thuringiensis serovar andalousiensis TaxID=257985 RepID=A0A6H0TQZ1_BACTU|nr:helix-turn-helix domain-containing protein [Bacillus thuringiensis]QIW22158.1 helix-turn-helix domain-containing protein [Bacillus thuringiensis serovar andalousiensis]